MSDSEPARARYFTRDRVEYWSLIAEIIAAAAVIVSLVFVGMQLRSANVIAVRDEANATMIQWSNIRRSIYADESVAQIFNKGLSDPAALNETERLRFGYLMSEYSWATWHIWDRIRAGLSPESHWENGAGRELLVILCRPGGREEWARIRQTMPPEFDDAVNELSRDYTGADGQACELPAS